MDNRSDREANLFIHGKITQVATKTLTGYLYVLWLPFAIGSHLVRQRPAVALRQLGLRLSGDAQGIQGQACMGIRKSSPIRSKQASLKWWLGISLP